MTFFAIVDKDLIDTRYMTATNGMFGIRKLPPELCGKSSFLGLERLFPRYFGMILVKREGEASDTMCTL